MSLKIKSSRVEYPEPVRDMGYSAGLKKNSSHQQMSRTAKEKIQPPRDTRNLSLQDKFRSERFINRSNTNLHHEIKRGVDDGPLIPPKSSRNHQKQFSDGKATQDDDLVKYMSNLPCYLQRMERGENLQEKTLNFGVLDWGSLEKWKYNEKQFLSRSSMYTPSTSNASSSFSTNGSSVLSSRSHSGSPAYQRTQSRSLYSSLDLSPNPAHGQDVKSIKVNVIDLQELRTVPKNTLVGQQKLPRRYQSFGRNYSEIRLNNVERKEIVPKIVPEMQTSSLKSKDYGVSFCPDRKMKARDGDFKKKTEQLNELVFSLPDHRCPGRHKNIILILPRDCSQRSCSVIPKKSESTTSVDERSTEVNQQTLSDSFYHNNEVQNAGLYSDIPQNCPLPCKVESNQESEMKIPASSCAQDTQVPLDAFHSPPNSNEIPTGQSKDKDAEENKYTIKPTNTIGNQLGDGFGLKAAKVPAVKVRNPSPNHQSSIGLGRLSRSFSVREDSTVPQLSSTYVTTKSGPVRFDASACLDNSGRDKPNANNRGRSSPLRRLLDPLLKHKAENRPEPLQDESASKHRVRKSNGQSESFTVHPVKRNLNLSSYGCINAEDSCLVENNVPSMVQALMHVTVKDDGLPWFRFAVDDSTSDILAATMRRVSTSQKDDYSWTFYTVREIKKKRSGWMNQGSKVKDRDYASNVVGQMNVSLSRCPMLTKHSFKDHFLVKEFVLFGVEQAGQETLDFQSNSELAAIVVKVPEETMGSLRNDGEQSYKNEELLDTGLNSCLPEDKCLCNSGENLQSSDVVILPIGVHGLPSTGVPSPLVDRWRSGGSCDCGGWDMGCKLRILSNQEKCSKNYSLSKASPTPDRFDLFIQGGAERNRPIFSLAPFKKGIYSVGFDGSVSSLQAFSICIAVLNNRNSYDLSEEGNLFEGKISQELVSMENDTMEVPSRVQPAMYIPFPPLSPVGRV